MKVVLLAGGFGSRISEESIFKPKPMIEIGGMPILWHIMKEYAYYGHAEFIVCAGYKQEYIKDWFANYFLHKSDVSFDFRNNKNEITIFNRSIHQKAVKKAIAVCSLSFAITMVSTILLSWVTEADLVDILYETVSATATVGLTRNLTSGLNIWGKLIIIATMYLGRVGPISLALVLNVKKEKWNTVKTPYEEISVG